MSFHDLNVFSILGWEITSLEHFFLPSYNMASGNISSSYNLLLHLRHYDGSSGESMLLSLFTLTAWPTIHRPISPDGPPMFHHWLHSYLFVLPVLISNRFLDQPILPLTLEFYSKNNNKKKIDLIFQLVQLHFF